MRTKLQIFIIRFRREISAVSAGLAAILLISIIHAATPTISAMVTTSDLPAGHKISSSDLKVTKIPGSLTWSSLLTKSENVIGKITSHAVAAGQPISSSDLISSDLLIGFNANQVAISIPLQSNRIDAYLTSGNHLDVYATQNGEPAILVAHNAVVLFVPVAKSGSFSLESNSNTSLILAVDSGESASISAYIGNGTFSFVLLPNS
jgi:hypothetical protein